MSKIKLNSGQQKAVDTLVSGFLSGDEKSLTLIGEGGTGKTTCIMAAAEEWAKAGLNVLFTAPTNKAVKQLEKSAREYGLKTDRATFCTVAKALGLALMPSEENKRATQVRESILGDFNILVIDEGSMVSQIAFFQYILPAVEDNNLCVVVMGDRMQLPPVRETTSHALEHFPKIELSEVERFGKESPIAALCSALRPYIDAAKPFHFNSQDFKVETVKPANFLKEIVEAFDADTDAEKVRVLAYTNARVDRINEAIRTKIYGRDAAVFEIGERVVTGGPVMFDREVQLSTDEECIVTQVIESSMLDDSTGDEYRTLLVTLDPIYADGGTIHCHVIHPEEEVRLRDKLNEIAAEAKKPSTSRQRSYGLWSKWHTLKDLFAVLKYCYCITVHRSQGSTYETVYVDVDNILTNKRADERRKLLYVAFSRASQRLITNKVRYSA